VRLAQYMTGLSEEAGYTTNGRVMPVYRPLERVDLTDVIRDVVDDIGLLDAPRQLIAGLKTKSATTGREYELKPGFSRTPGQLNVV